MCSKLCADCSHYNKEINLCEYFGVDVFDVTTCENYEVTELPERRKANGDESNT